MKQLNNQRISRLLLLLFMLAGSLTVCQAGSNPDSDYLVAFKSDKLIGYKDANTGAVVIEPAYKIATPFFNEGRAVVSHMEKGKPQKKTWDVIRPDGSVAFTVISDTFPGEFNGDGWLVMKGPDGNGKVRYDVDGNMQRYPENFVSFATDRTYWDADDEYPNMRRAKATCKRKGLSEVFPVRFGYVDVNTLEVVIPFDFDTLGEFNDGIAYYRQGDECGFIDATGKKVQTFPEMDWINLANFDAIEQDYQVKNAVYNDNRLWVNPAEVDDKGKKKKNFTNPVAVDRDYNKVIDSEGKFWLPNPYRHGYSSVCLRDVKTNLDWLRGIKVLGWCYLDTQGNVASPTSYSVANNFVDYGDGRILARVSANGNWGYINQDFKDAIPVIYAEIDPYLDSDAGKLSVRARAGKVWGVVDENNNIVIPFLYERLDSRHNGMRYGWKKVDGKIKPVFVDKEGNEMFPQGIDDSVKVGGTPEFLNDRDLGYWYKSLTNTEEIPVIFNKKGEVVNQ